MHLKLLATALAGALGLAAIGGASAQAAPNAATWNGPYAGVLVGAQLGSAEFSLPGDVSDVLLKSTAGKTAFEGGALVGFDHQMGDLVVGVEGDFTDTNRVRQVTACNVTDGCWTPNHDSFTTHNLLKETEQGHVRLRAGMASGNSLFYVAGGYSIAAAQLNLIGDCWNSSSPSTPLVFTYQRNETLSGFNVGAGVETALSRHLSMRAEYLFDDYGAHLFPGDGAEWNDRRISVKNSNLRVGVSYRF